MFLARESPKLSRAMLAAGLSAGIAAAVIFIAFTNRELTVEPIVIGIVLGLITGMAFGYGWRWLLLRNVANAAVGLAGDDFTCGHELRLDDAELVETTESTEHRTKYSAIPRIERTDDHVFIFVDRIRAHVIPARAADGVDVFVAELEARRRETVG